MTTDADIAWAAGLFEGEGCFFATDRYQRKTGTRRVLHSAQLGSSDKDIVERFHAIVGVGGIIEVRSRNPLHKQMWRWQIQSRSGVEQVGEMLRPWLGERRLAKLDEILAVQPMNHDPLTCDGCGVEFVPQRDRRGHGRVFCTNACGSRFHAHLTYLRKKEATIG